MIPSRDRIGQIRSYSRWLQNRLGTAVRGMWIPERVWEQALARDLVDAGIEYTILDDFHFKMAGLTDARVDRPPAHRGRGPAAVGLSRQRAAALPDPLRRAASRRSSTWRKVSEEHPDAVVVFGDDGEKFGTWPETKKHVYEDGWLVRFFDALVANQDWIQVTTPAEAIDNVPPLGKVYLPDCSYREMTEWALPTEQLVGIRAGGARDAATIRAGRCCGGSCAAASGGTSRRSIPEADEMYSRMMMVSRRLQEAVDEGAAGPLVEQARTELYRGQCNCGYWHGAFGGIYLPHLRNAVYRSLIAADNLLDRAAGRPETWVEATADDFNFDARQEVRLANDRLLALIAPSRGGQMVELDVRKIQHNLLATLTRQPEAYHRKVLAGANQRRRPRAPASTTAWSSSRPDLDQRIQYDNYPRKSLLDLFYDNDATLAAVAAGTGGRARATSSTPPTKPASAAIPTASRCN